MLLALDPLGFLGQLLGFQLQALDLGRGGSGGIAERRHGAGLIGLCRAFAGDGDQQFPDPDFGSGEDGLAVFKLGLGINPFLVQQQGFRLPDAIRHGAVAGGLPGLLFQIGELVFHGAQHILDPFEVALGGFQPEFGLVTAGMETADTGSFLKDRAALGRLGIDDRANLALTDHGGRGCTGAVIGEQDLDVAGTYRLAIDPVIRAVAALNLSGDFQIVEIIEWWRDGLAVIFQTEGDFCHVTGRAVGGTAKDDVFHLAAAHTLGRGLAHDPAQRLHKVRLATAVRPNNTGKTRCDCQFGRFDKAFETMEAELGKLH